MGCSLETNYGVCISPLVIGQSCYRLLPANKSHQLIKNETVKHVSFHIATLACGAYNALAILWRQNGKAFILHRLLTSSGLKLCRNKQFLSNGCDIAGWFSESV